MYHLTDSDTERLRYAITFMKADERTQALGQAAGELFEALDEALSCAARMGLAAGNVDLVDLEDEEWDHVWGVIGNAFKLLRSMAGELEHCVPSL